MKSNSDDAQKVLDLLKKVRASKTVSLSPSKFLRKEIQALDGSTVPFNLRYYQVQGVFHFLSVNRMVLGDSTGLGKCLAKCSRLLTKNGLVEIQTLAPASFDWSKPEGFYPMGHLEEVWTGTKWAPLKSFYWSGRKPSIRITTRNGYQLEGSQVHPVLIRDEHGTRMVPLSEIKSETFACIDRASVQFPSVGPAIPFGVDGLSQKTWAKSYYYPTHLTEDLATLLGYIVSEGYTNDDYHTTVTQHKGLNSEPHIEIRQLFKLVFGWEGNETNKERDISIAVSSVEIRSYLRACGVGDDLSRTKEVPWCIWHGTQEQVRNFVSAMIEAEGSVADGGVEFSSASESLARGMQLLLLRLGVVSTLSPKRVKKYDHTYWRLTFFGDDARKFVATIGFRSSRKTEEIQAKLASNSNPNKVLGLTRDVGLEHTPEYKAVQTLVDQNYFYDPIVKIEHFETELMDVEVDDPEHTFWSNGFISHNTAQSIAAMCYIWEKDPTYKVIVVCPKSAIRQWSSEVKRFADGVETYISQGTPKQREAAIREWAASKEPSVLITNYHGLVKDWDAGMTKEAVPSDAPKGTVGRTSKGLLDGITANIPNLLTVFDECTAFKTPSTKTAQVCRFLSDRSKRVWGLTATLLKNNLIEGFGIYQVIRPGTFGSKSKFLNEYCDVEMQRIKGGGKIPIIRGYRNLDHFRKTIEPYYYGRNKHEVASDLPSLQTKEVLCEMSKEEEAKYVEALSGVLDVMGETKDYKETKALTSLIYLQEICDSLALIDPDFKGRSAKETGLVDLLTDEFEDEKVIVYTKYERMVTRLTEILKAEGIQSVRITGKESDKERKKAQDAFQDLKSKTRVVFITDAGSEAINLQAAGAFVFFDSPWSWGNYVQCLDSETEVLTKRGFIGQAQIKSDDLVAAMSLDNSAINWQPIRSIVRRPLNEGESMYSMSTRHVDIRVTGGHRMVFKRQTSTKDRKRYWPTGWRVELAEEMAAEASNFRIPACGFESGRGVNLTDSQLEFIGWFLTDGSLNRQNGTVYITQAVHQPQIHDLRRCLKECGFDWKEYPRTGKDAGCYPNGKPQILFAIPQGTHRGALKRNGWHSLLPYLDKDFSPLLEDLSREQLGVLLEAIHLGDGAKCVTAGQTWVRRSWHIFSVRKAFADRIQSLCVRRGFRCNISVREATEKNQEGYTLHIKNYSFWNLMGGNAKIGVGEIRSRFERTDSVPGEMVWCVENDTGTLVTRRKGKVAVLGNCLGRMIRIGSMHQSVYAIHLVAERPGKTAKQKESLDHKVLKALRKKKGLIDQILGESAQGALRFERSEDMVHDLLRSLREEEES